MIKLNTISIHIQASPVGGLTALAKLGPYAYITPNMVATITPVEKPTESGLDAKREAAS